jgi:catechol 2,3-dioxygenase-like lactoylglutathione lyase family enzyme
MFIRKIHHVQIAAPPGSEEQARTFFAGILGLKEIPKPANLATRGGAWFSGGDLEIHVGIDHDFKPARKAHVALQTDDLDGLRHHLQQHHIDIWEDEPLPGYRRFYAADPFGNRMEFVERAVGQEAMSREE